MQKYKLDINNLFQYMVEGVCLQKMIFDKDNTPINYEILNVNDAYQIILGIKKENVVNRLSIIYIKPKNRMIVEDSGDTINKHDFMDIFKRGVRLEKSSTRGSGLGLAIVKRIAEAHSGKAWGEPINPIGNRFILEIPNKKN